MSGFPVLDVAIGLAFIYALFALSCTTLNEIIAGFFTQRGAMLKNAIQHLLGDKSLADALYGHPSIVSLGKPDAKGGALPSYIPGMRFATVLSDHLTGTQSLSNGAALAAGIQSLNPAIARQLQVLLDLSKGDPDQFRARVADWYDETMDRVSGWYKAKVQRRTYILATILVLALNLDSVLLFNRLWSDSAFRTAAVEQAKARIEATGTAEVPVMEYTEGDKTDAGTPVQTGTVSLTDSEKDLLASLGGWEADRRSLASALILNGDQFSVRARWFGQLLLAHFLGWLVTILAVSLGAPFWFDLLNRFMNLRNAGRATDEPRSKVGAR